MKKVFIVTGVILTFLIGTNIQGFAEENVIYGCIGPVGQLRIVDDPSECSKSETAISWNDYNPAIIKGLQAQIDRLQAQLEECCGIEWTDLAALVDDDNIHGEGAHWNIEECGYLFEASQPRAYISLPYELVGSYELSAHVNILRSMEKVAFILPVDDAYIEFGIASGNEPSETAIMYLKGLTPTMLQWPDQEIVVGEEYEYFFDIVVNGASCVIQILVNNGLLYSWEGDISDIDPSIQPEYAELSWIELETAYYTQACFAQLKARTK